MNFFNKKDTNIIKAEKDEFNSKKEQSYKMLNEIENIKKLFFESLYTSQDINENLLDGIKTSSLTLKSMGENINTSLNAMENVAEDIAQSTSKSEKLNEIVSKTNMAISNGNNFSENLYLQITQTEKSIGETLNTIKNLEANSKRISLFTSKINNISKQTNLLALNAAIEAARAGDAGKGFSIVAQEVKNLSQLTQEAANEIENELQSFIEEIGETIKKSEESKADLEKGLDLIEQTKEIYYELKSVDRELQETSSEIYSNLDQGVFSISKLAEEIENIKSSLNKAYTDIQNVENTNKLNNNKEEIESQLIEMFNILNIDY